MDDRFTLRSELEHTFDNSSDYEVHLLLIIPNVVRATMGRCEVRIQMFLNSALFAYFSQDHFLNCSG